MSLFHLLNNVLIHLFTILNTLGPHIKLRNEINTYVFHSLSKKQIRSSSMLHAALLIQSDGTFWKKMDWKNGKILKKLQPHIKTTFIFISFISDLKEQHGNDHSDESGRDMQEQREKEWIIFHVTPECLIKVKWVHLFRASLASSTLQHRHMSLVLVILQESDRQWHLHNLPLHVIVISRCSSDTGQASVRAAGKMCIMFNGNCSWLHHTQLGDTSTTPVSPRCEWQASVRHVRRTPLNQLCLWGMPRPRWPAHHVRHTGES